MFRASPWVTYHPTASPHQSQIPSHSNDMDDDVDMDAPLISTLPEEKTPPPSSARKAAGRKGKTAKAKLASDFPTWTRPAVKDKSMSEDELAEEGEEEEEDQLIDDDDDGLANPAPTPASVLTKTPEAGQKKKAPVKRKSRKEPGAEEEGKKRKKEKLSHSAGTPSLVPTAPGLEATPSDSHEDAGGGADTPSISVVESEPQDPSSTPNPPKLSKKKSSTPRKSASTPKTAKAKPSKLKMVIPALSAVIADDVSVMSEGGVTGTAASSPITAHLEGNEPGSPEPEQPLLASSPAPPAAPLIEETNLENIPLPIYPLPSKPFPVQPPPKIPTGFAPPIPLDKGGKKVRHWRIANREIRGIGGGRWFTRTWVGDKESEYAQAVVAKELGNGSITIPKLSSTSISAPPLGRSAGKKGKGASSLTASAAPSRDGSVIPDSVPIPISSTVRAPTKMRIQQLPYDEAQSDTAMDTDPIPAPPSEP